MNPFRPLALAAAVLGLSLSARAQSVGIGTTAPNASALLELQSTSQGLLLPRLTLAQRTALTASPTAPPVPGLLIYQTDNAPGLYAYDGTAWLRLGADNLGNHTATQALNLGANALTGTGADLGAAVGVGVTAQGGLNIGQNTPGANIFVGYGAGAVTTGVQNLFVGYFSGNRNTTGSINHFVGTGSGGANTTGSNNYFAGNGSGAANTTASDNFFEGNGSGNRNTLGARNFFVGNSSGAANTVGNNNQFVGNGSGVANTTGNNNFFNGYQSGGANVSGDDNLFVGYQSGGSNTTGSFNHFVGYQSGYANTSGSSNFFEGYQAGIANTTGTSNYFSGYASGGRTTTGSNNTYVGNVSGSNDPTGYNNTYVGYQTGVNTSASHDNVLLGYLSGDNNDTGTNNTFVGARSGFNNVSGSYNVALGFVAGPSISNLTNTASIGYNAHVRQSNSLVLGGTGANAMRVGIGTEAPRGALDVAGPGDIYLVNDPNSGTVNQSGFLPGHLYLAPYFNTNTAYVQARVPSPNANTAIGLTLRTTSNGGLVDALRLAANGAATFTNTATGPAFTATSDARFKTNVRPLTGALAAVQQLRGVRYQWNALGQQHGGQAGAEQIGLLAQELEALYPELVHTDAQGYKSVNYAQLTPVLLEALKELAARNAALDNKNAALETQVQQQQASLGSFEQRLRALEAGTAQAQR